jgi:dipeptidase
MSLPQFLLSILLLLSLITITYGCTAILVGRDATVDGSTLTTHNNDCTDCDIRIAVVPAKSYNPDKDKCNIYPCKFSYPRFVGSDRGDTYKEEYLNDEKVANIYKASQPIHTIEQVKSTYSYIEGTYPIANEHQLMMGESTCAAKFVAYGNQ